MATDIGSFILRADVMPDVGAPLYAGDVIHELRKRTSSGKGAIQYGTAYRGELLCLGTVEWHFGSFPFDKTDEVHG